jgi:hypothetical protein
MNPKTASEQMFPNATARPWKSHPDLPSIILGGDGHQVADTRGEEGKFFNATFRGQRERHANEALALHAVNTYDARDLELRAAEARFTQIADLLLTRGVDFAYDLAKRGADACKAILVVKP